MAVAQCDAHSVFVDSLSEHLINVKESDLLAEYSTVKSICVITDSGCVCEQRHCNQFLKKCEKSKWALASHPVSNFKAKAHL